MENTTHTNVKIEYKDLLDAGVHFGHLTRKWNPKMAPYIFMERNGIHIIDLNKTIASLEEAIYAIKNIVRGDRKVLFVATKKQAKEVVTDIANNLNMPYITDRWLGGVLTNFSTIRRSIVKMNNLEKMMKEETFQNLAKRERLMKMREYEKQQRIFGGIKNMTRIPAAMIVVDVLREHIAVTEANKLGIPVFALVDTNSDPSSVDFPIPANDDAFKSISILLSILGKGIEEGLMESKAAKEKSDAEAAEENDETLSFDTVNLKKYEAGEEEESDEAKTKRRRKKKVVSEEVDIKALAKEEEIEEKDVE